MDVKTKTLKLATALTFNMVRRICLTVSMRFSRGLNRHSWTRRLSRVDYGRVLNDTPSVGVLLRVLSRASLSTNPG